MNTMAILTYLKNGGWKYVLTGAISLTCIGYISYLNYTLNSLASDNKVLQTVIAGQKTEISIIKDQKDQVVKINQNIVNQISSIEQDHQKTLELLNSKHKDDMKALEAKYKIIKRMEPNHRNKRERKNVSQI